MNISQGVDGFFGDDGSGPNKDHGDRYTNACSIMNDDFDLDLVFNATPVASGGESMSLGQRQLVAFIRAALRRPELLILDEATANIDTVTEQHLNRILANLPATTTRVVIAHRLNTIERAVDRACIAHIGDDEFSIERPSLAILVNVGPQRI